MAVIVFLSIATALFLGQPAIAGGTLIAATLLAVLTVYLVDRARRSRRAAACAVVRIPRQRIASGHRVPEGGGRTAAERDAA